MCLLCSRTLGGGFIQHQKESGSATDRPVDVQVEDKELEYALEDFVVDKAKLLLNSRKYSKEQLELALCYAAKIGNADLVIFFVEHCKVDAHCKITDTLCSERTPLHFACCHGQFHVAEYLAATGGERAVKARDGDGNEPWIVAIQHNFHQLGRYLIEDQDLKIKWDKIKEMHQNPLVHAIWRDDLVFAKFLIVEKGADVNAVVERSSRINLLHLAVEKRGSDFDRAAPTIQFLLNYGASKNATNKKGETPLMYAYHYWGKESRIGSFLKSLGFKESLGKVKKEKK